MSKIFKVFLSLFLSVGLISCGSNETTTTSSTEKPKVRIAFCNNSLLEGLPEALVEKFPDVEFEFSVANNTAKYYTYLAEHDDLPDIITVRRFSLLDSVNLKDDLVDLSKTEIAASYYQNYLTNYTYDDGTVNWLPSAGEVWCIVANKTLFEENNIEIPTDYASFIEACNKFEALGIQGYTTDWSYDYSSLEVLEGFNIEKLQTSEGKKWRQGYESGSNNSLEESIWLPAFEHLQDMLNETENIASDETEAETLTTQGFSSTQAAMDGREVAMIRSSASEIIGYNSRNDDEYILLPYFGEKDNWLLTYPNFQAAMNKNSEVDSDLLLEIYTFLLGQEGQDALDMGSNVISYSKDVNLSYNEYLESLSDYVTSNQIFIRLANDDFFTASKTAVQGMIKGEYDASEAFKVFNETLASTSADVTYDLQIDTGYDYSFGENGSEASSALLNSCRSVWGTDLAITYSISLSNSIYDGAFSSSYVKYLISGNYGANYYLELTGAEVKALVSAMLYFEPTEEDDTYIGLIPLNASMLPVSSGFEMDISVDENGHYALNKLTIDGTEMDDETTYTIIYSCPGYYAQHIASKANITLPEGSNKIVDNMTTTITNYLTENTSFLEPTKYIKISN